jgi:hypothetical protein
VLSADSFSLNNSSLSISGPQGIAASSTKFTASVSLTCNLTDAVTCISSPVSFTAAKVRGATNTARFFGGSATGVPTLLAVSYSIVSENESLANVTALQIGNFTDAREEVVIGNATFPPGTVGGLAGVSREGTYTVTAGGAAVCHDSGEEDFDVGSNSTYFATAFRCIRPSRASWVAGISVMAVLAAALLAGTLLMACWPRRPPPGESLLGSIQHE